MIKYIHFNNENKAYYPLTRNQKRSVQSRTLAAKLPSNPSVTEFATDFVNLKKEQTLYCTFDLGISLLHPKDRYEKKVGRASAVAKMKSVTFEVLGVSSNKTHTVIDLGIYQGIFLSLQVNKNTGFTTILGQLKEAY